MRKVLVMLCALVLIAAAQAHAAGPGYHLIKRLKLGGAGGWDYLMIDGAARRLYVPRSTHVMVVDLDTDKVVGDIPDTPGVHGVALAPELGRGFTSDGKSNTATIFDLKTLKAVGVVKTGANPDAILYDPASRKVFTFNGRSHDATVIDAASGKVVSTIALPGKPEFATADGKGKVFVNIEDRNEVVEIDSLKSRASRQFSLKPCEEPTGMALDATDGKVFSGCHNRVMTVLDAKAGKVVATVPIGANVDGNGFDAERKLAFSSNGDGTLTVVDASSEGNYRVLQTVTTQRGARTMAIDPVTHDIYLAVARFASPERGAKQRPEMIKDSFEILVVGE